MTTEFQVKVGDEIALIAHPWIYDVWYDPLDQSLKVTCRASIPIGIQVIKNVAYTNPLQYNMPFTLNNGDEVSVVTSTTKKQVIADEIVQVEQQFVILNPTDLTAEQIQDYVSHTGRGLFGKLYDIAAEKKKISATKIVHTKYAGGGIVPKSGGDFIISGFSSGVVNLPSGKSGYNVMAADVKKMLPGVSQKIECPRSVNCIDKGYNGEPFTDSIWGMVMHLNDHHQIPREEIADWLDELHDNGVVDLEITSPDQDKA